MVFKILKALKLLLKTTCNCGGIALFLLGENLFKTLFYLIDFQQNISYRLSHRICLSSRQRQKVFTYVVIIFHLLLSLWDQRSSLAGGAQVKVKQSQSSVQAATTSRWNSLNDRLNLTYCWNTWFNVKTPSCDLFCFTQKGKSMTTGWMRIRGFN